MLACDSYINVNERARAQPADTLTVGRFEITVLLMNM